MKETEVVVVVVFPAGDEAPEAIEPGEEALDGPAPLAPAEGATVPGLDLAVLAVGRDERDPVPLAQLPGQGVAVVGFVSDQVSDEGPDLPRDRFERFVDEPDFGGVGAVEGESQRKAASVDHCHDLAALAPLGSADRGPPFFAARKVASMGAWFTSRRPRSKSSTSNRRRIFSHSPVLDHSWNRRWQVW